MAQLVAVTDFKRMYKEGHAPELLATQYLKVRWCEPVGEGAF